MPLGIIVTAAAFTDLLEEYSEGPCAGIEGENIWEVVLRDFYAKYFLHHLAVSSSDVL